MEDRQGLLPGIPDHVTMFYIAPKLKWKTCNVLRMVSRKWQHVICTRGVYDAKVRSNTTEPFLVLLWGFQNEKIVLNLYSCKDGSYWELPPVSCPNAFYIDCICLAGQVLVWVTTRTFVTECWTLDLAGDMKWAEPKRAQRIWAEDSLRSIDCGYGVLEGKIYRFRGSTNSELGPARGLKPSRPQTPFLRKVLHQPQVEVYDRQCDVWSLITPEAFQLPQDILPADEPNLQRHLGLLGEWAAERQAADLSKTFLLDGMYDPYFSEWRRRRSMGSLTTSTDDNCENAMATQVFYSHEVYVTGVPHHDESFFFCGARLLKLTRRRFDHPFCPATIQLYDTQKNKWGLWKVISPHFDARDGTRYIDSWSGCDFVSADNALWTTFSKVYPGGFFLVRSSVLFPEESDEVLRSPVRFPEKSDEVLTWIDTGFRDPSLYQFPERIRLRPIYI